MKNKKLLEYINEQRWCNFKEDIKENKVKEILLESGEFIGGKIFFVIGKAKIKGKEDKYFIMPLSKGKMKEEYPLVYKRYKVYDALKNKDYWNSMMSTIGLNKTFVISKEYKLIYQSWDNFNYIMDHIKDKSKPLGVEQSNSTLMIGDKEIAFKQQRYIEFSTLPNPEVEMNYNLMKVNCPVVAKTYGHLFLLSSKGENAFVGIVQEFIDNKGDLWEISTKSIMELLMNKYKKRDEKIEYKDYKELKKMMTNLGKKTWILRKSLESFSKEKDMMAENITLKYIKEYKENLREKSENTKTAIKKNIKNLPLFIKERCEKLLKNWDECIEKFISTNIEKIEKRRNKGKLMRVHGDFHLGQAILTKKDEIKFIDFSGEPNLSFQERQKKNPDMYDVASMYRSIDGYLKASVINKFSIKDDGEIDKEKALWSYNIVDPIIKDLTISFLKHQKINKEWLDLEILRRNLYEVNYEIAYRPKMLFVPILNLLNLLGLE